MNAIFNTVFMEEFKRISNVEVTHTAWNILQTMHEGIKAVKNNKLQQLAIRFESIRMSDDESFDEFYAKLNDIINYAYNLGEIYDEPKIVRKILRSLIENFRPKVTAITESKDVDSIPINELVGSLNNAEPRNFRRNEPTKVNNTEKPKKKVGQTSNNFMGQQCFDCQGYSHVKSECPTFLRSKGKAMAVTLSDNEVSDHEFSSDEDGNFITFTTTVVVYEHVVVVENPSDGELSKSADLQEAYNKLCKVATKDAVNIDIGLQKIASLELDKKNLLLKLFDVNELLDKVKTENILLLDKVKNLELELSVAREQTNRTASSKLGHMFSIQKSTLNKTGLGFEDSITVSKNHSINFFSSSKPPLSEPVKPTEVTPPRKIRVDLKEFKPKTPNLPKDKVHNKPTWVCYFCGKSKHIRPNYFKLQAAK